MVNAGQQSADKQRQIPYAIVTNEGESDVRGAVVVAESGHWKGKLKADIVVVAGRFEGDITAREKIEVLNGAHINGNLACPNIAMETGAIHDGRLSMHSKLSHFEEKREAGV
ncbi:MAG: polymer-forming cytoskeletal protein [Gammaproteobacteria bacterium]